MRPATRRLALAAATLAMALAALGGCREPGHDVIDAGIVQPPPAAARTGASLPLPQDFPRDVYLPPAYDIHSVLDMDDARVLNLRARGEVGELFADARIAMAHLGWQQMMAMQHADDSAMLSFEKGGRSVVLSFGGSRSDDEVALGMQLRGHLH